MPLRESLCSAYRKVLWCMRAHPDAPSMISTQELLTSHTSPRRGCWWASKVGEDLSKPTNEVPAVRKSPVDLPVMLVPRNPDVSQVIIRPHVDATANGRPPTPLHPAAVTALSFATQAPARALSNVEFGQKEKVTWLG